MKSIQDAGYVTNLESCIQLSASEFSMCLLWNISRINFDSNLRLNYNGLKMISVYEMTVRLLLGTIIGGIIGFEREVHGRAAGFRTQLIVCVAAVLIMIISENYYFYIQQLDPALRIDPARIASGALIGIGFLGAGVIVKSGFAIRGITTAASIWIVSAIGLAIGSGLYLEGIITFSITIIALVVLRRFEKYVKTLQYKVITVKTATTKNVEETVTAIFSDCGIHIHSIDYEKDQKKEELTYIFTVSTKNKNAIKDVFLKLVAMDFIRNFKIDSQDKIGI